MKLNHCLQCHSGFSSFSLSELFTYHVLWASPLVSFLLLVHLSVSLSVCSYHSSLVIHFWNIHFLHTFVVTSTAKNIHPSRAVWSLNYPFLHILLVCRRYRGRPEHITSVISGVQTPVSSWYNIKLDQSGEMSFYHLWSVN